MPATNDDLLRVLLEIREGQHESGKLYSEVLALALESERKMDAWRVELREQQQKTLQRYRIMIRVYAGMMVLLGALLATTWINLFSH